jgi:hypothetical protein
MTMKMTARIAKFRKNALMNSIIPPLLVGFNDYYKSGINVRKMDIIN